MIGARTRWADPSGLAAYIDQHGGPPLDARRWQPWLLDHPTAQVRHRERGCCIDLRECATPRGLLDQVAEVARSPWSTDADVDTLLRALSDVLPAPLRVPLVALDDDAVRRLAQQAATRCTPTPWRSTCP